MDPNMSTGHTPDFDSQASRPQSGSDWEQFAPQYRRQWERQYGSAGYQWEEFEPGYRYGHEVAYDPQFEGRQWNDVESDLRSDYDTWARRQNYDYEKSAWDRLKDSVREAWEGARGTGQHRMETGGMETGRMETGRVETGPGYEHERRDREGDYERGSRGGSVELREEELRARKQDVEAGAVNIRKEVVSEQQTMEVPVTREEVYVERHSVDRREASDRPIGEGESIRVPVREEEVTVEKRPVVREEIRVGKQEVQETERVSDTVRREEARIEGEGGVDVRGGSGRAAHEHRYLDDRCADCGEPRARNI